MTIERIDETMAKIDIISGFLGAGKTTLIKKLIAVAFAVLWLVTLERNSKRCLQNIVRIVLLLSHPELASCLMWSKQ